jgi:hypothetical protein
LYGMQSLSIRRKVLFGDTLRIITVRERDNGCVIALDLIVETEQLIAWKYFFTDEHRERYLVMRYYPTINNVYQ